MKKILILEDDSILKSLYSVILKDYVINIVDDVKSAIQLSKENHYDLFITDLRLNGSDETGVDFIKTGIAPVLIVSAVDLHQMSFGKPMNYLQKPIRNTILLSL